MKKVSLSCLFALHERVIDFLVNFFVITSFSLLFDIILFFFTFSSIFPLNHNVEKCQINGESFPEIFLFSFISVTYANI